MNAKRCQLKSRPSTAPGTPRGLWGAMLAIYGVSGFCALSVETLWIRTLSARIGSTVVTATAVISVFFACAAIGNYWGSRRAPGMARPVAWYGICELLAALSTGLLFAFRGPLQSAIIGPALGWRLLYVLLLTGLPSLFAGAAFPALSQAMVRASDRRTRDGGAFYGANLIGAAIGVLGGGLMLPSAFGNAESIAIAITLQVVIGCAALLVSRKWPSGGIAASTATQFTRLSPALGYAVLVASGLLSLLIEMLVLTYFQQFTPASLYAMTAVLFAFIVNLGLGSLIVSRLRGKGVSTEFLLIGALVLSGMLLLVYPRLLDNPLQSGILPPQESLAAWTTRAVGIATLMFAPMLIPVGMVFPLGWEIIERSSVNQGQPLGRAMAMNKAACAVGAFIGPFVLVPTVGLSATMSAAGFGYVLLAGWTGVQAKVPKTVCAAIVLLSALGFIRCPVPVGLGAGERLIHAYQGPDGVVAVTEDERSSRHIVLNQRYTLNGTNKSLLSQQEESWIPIFLTAKPDRIAFIGMASGISATAALDFPIKDLRAVELVHDVARAAREHFGTWNSRLFSDSRAHVVVDDGRFVVQSSREKYDVIITDLLNPSLEGAGMLYSKEFFQAERAALAPGGRCCVWLPMYQLDDELAGTMLRTFTDVFPNAILVRGNFDPLQPIVGVIGANEPIDLSGEFVARRLREAPRIARIGSPFLNSVPSVRLFLMGDLGAVRSDFESYQPNTDDNQRFAFLGPKLIERGTVLRGFTLLHSFGTRFEGRGFSSCDFGNTRPDEIEKGIMAGNYYFAASVSSAAIPVDALAQIRREAQAEEYLRQAHAIFPAMKLGRLDLGR